MARELEDLLKRIEGVTGADRDLDRRIGQGLDRLGASDQMPDYTASVDHCIALIGRILPHWAWHVGYGPRGILPYATLHDEEQRFEAIAPTVPLALLAALVKARIAVDGGQP